MSADRAFAITWTQTALKLVEAIPDQRIRRLLTQRADQLARSPEQQGKPLIGELVGIAETEQGDWIVRFADIDLGLIDRRTKKLRRFQAGRQRGLLGITVTAGRENRRNPVRLILTPGRRGGNGVDLEVEVEVEIEILRPDTERPRWRQDERGRGRGEGRRWGK